MKNKGFTIPPGAKFDLNTGQWWVPNKSYSGHLPDGSFQINGAITISPGPDSIEPELGPLLNNSERGAVLQVGPPYTGDGTNVRRSAPVATDDDALRVALLFSDMIDWPNTNVAFSRDGDPQGLVSAGALRRTPVEVSGVLTAELLNASPFDLYRRLDAREPGRWTIWHDQRVDPIPDDESEPDLAFQLRLQNALIVPHREVAFEDVLAFRSKYRGELVALRTHLERLAIQVSKSGWNPREQLVEIEDLDRAIAEYLEVARKPNWKKALAHLELSMNWSDVARGLFTATPATIASVAAGLPLTSALIAVGVPVTAGVTLKSAKGVKGATSPFKYLATIDREFG